MNKYKYVDGVKYKVVPQSVLGYALVKVDDDNPLPVGGTEGQVLTKASDADYDVEWSTVESGGGTAGVFYVDIAMGEQIDDPPVVATDINDIIEAINAGMLVVAKLTFPGYDEIQLIPLSTYTVETGGMVQLSFELAYYTIGPDETRVGAIRVNYASIGGWAVSNTSTVISGVVG